MGSPLPCPYCGNAATSVFPYDSGIGSLDTEARMEYTVVCAPCRMHGPVHETIRDAVAAWDRVAENGAEDDHR